MSSALCQAVVRASESLDQAHWEVWRASTGAGMVWRRICLLVAALVAVLSICVTGPQVVRAADNPTASTENASDVTSNQARLNGTLLSLGTGSSANVSFQWGPDSDRAANETPPQAMDLPGPFSADIANLSANTTYYFRAKATGQGVGLGDERIFHDSRELSGYVFLNHCLGRWRHSDDAGRGYLRSLQRRGRG